MRKFKRDVRFPRWCCLCLQQKRLRLWRHNPPWLLCDVIGRRTWLQSILIVIVVTLRTKMFTLFKINYHRLTILKPEKDCCVMVPGLRVVLVELSQLGISLITFYIITLWLWWPFWVWRLHGSWCLGATVYKFNVSHVSKKASWFLPLLSQLRQPFLGELDCQFVDIWSGAVSLCADRA